MKAALVLVLVVVHQHHHHHRLQRKKTVQEVSQRLLDCLLRLPARPVAEHPLSLAVVRVAQKVIYLYPRGG